MQSSGKDVSSGAVSKGKLALRDSNVATTGATRAAKGGNGKPASSTAQTARVSKPASSTVDAVDRPVRVSKRAATGIPSRSKSASTASTYSRSNSVQSTASQKTTASTAASARTVAAKEDRGVKRIKTERGEKRVAGVVHKDSEGLLHKKASVQEEEVREQGPAKDEGWEDLDAEDADDPLMVAEYVNEIFDYMKELEVGRASDLTAIKADSALCRTTDGLYPQR